MEGGGNDGAARGAGGVKGRGWEGRAALHPLRVCLGVSGSGSVSVSVSVRVWGEG